MQVFNTYGYHFWETKQVECKTVQESVCGRSSMAVRLYRAQKFRIAATLSCSCYICTAKQSITRARPELCMQVICTGNRSRDSIHAHNFSFHRAWSLSFVYILDIIPVYFLNVDPTICPCMEGLSAAHGDTESRQLLRETLFDILCHERERSVNESRAPNPEIANLGQNRTVAIWPASGCRSSCKHSFVWCEKCPWVHSHPCKSRRQKGTQTSLMVGGELMMSKKRILMM
jgi:hypothetical protein